MISLYQQDVSDVQITHMMYI